MPLFLRLALRELRAGIRGFRIFLACLVLSVTAITAALTLGESLQQGLKADAKALLGGDVDLRLVQRPADGPQLTYLADHSAAMSIAVEMRAMALSGEKKRQLVELKAVDGAYPLVGEMALDPVMSVKEALAEKNGVPGAIADPGLLRRLGLKVGDTVRLGGATFELRASVLREPDRVASVVNFGPRLMIALSWLSETGLVLPGSQVRYRYRLMLTPEEDLEIFKRDLDEAFPKAGWRVRDAGDAAPGVRRFIERMTLFLSFAGLTSLLVGGIGIFGGVRAHMESRMKTIAIMKMVGASGRLILKTYSAQVALLGAFGVAVGLVLGTVLPWLASKALGDVLPIRIVSGIDLRLLGISALFGMLSVATFSFLALMQARKVPAVELFRASVDGLRGKVDGKSRLGFALLVSLLAGLTILSASDKWFACWFVGGTIVILLGSAYGNRFCARHGKKGGRLERLPFAWG